MSDVDAARWRQRRIVDEAAFLLPYLQKGICVLDAGCGPGSLTLDIAERVAPGLVIGLDRHAGRLATARQSARQSSMRNVQFQKGDVAGLPIKNGGVDLVFAHGLLEHLQQPVCVVKEFHRILKAGAIVGLRSPDWGAAILDPANTAMWSSITLRNRWQRYQGGDPEVGRKLKGILRAAGFVDLTVRAEAVHEMPAALRDYMHRILRDPELQDLAPRQGWARAADLADMLSAWSAWSAHLDAFAASIWCHAIAMKPV